MTQHVHKEPTTLTLEGRWGTRKIDATLHFSDSLTLREAHLVRLAWEKGFEAGVASCLDEETQ